MGGSYTNYTNTKKIDDNFDYPYVIKLVHYKWNNFTHTITFENESKATVYGLFERIHSGLIVGVDETHNFTKR